LHDERRKRQRQPPERIWTGYYRDCSQHHSNV
jgi:hypothetical protein